MPARERAFKVATALTVNKTPNVMLNVTGGAQAADARAAASKPRSRVRK